MQKKTKKERGRLQKNILRRGQKTGAAQVGAKNGENCGPPGGGKAKRGARDPGGVLNGIKTEC